MATTTTNYGFDVPTSSDLVKNGATQIALLGQDLDTFLFRPFTRNGALNSGLNVWQRGTSIAVTSATATYTADRWNFYPNGATNAQTVSRQATNDTTNLPNIQYCGRFQRNSGQTGTGAIFLCNSFESVNSIPYIGKQVTFSFYARAGANFSSASNALAYKVYTGTGTDQLSNTGYTGAAAFVSATATLTTTWQRFTATGTASSSGTEVSIEFSHTPSGTAGTNDYYEITGVQLEVGNQASPYAPATPTYATELAACQRYYYKTYNLDITPGTSATTGAVDYVVGSDGGGNALQSFRFPVTMRSNPTVIAYQQGGTSGSWGYARLGASGTSAVTIDTFGQNGIRFYQAVGLNWAVAQVFGHLVASAEL
jgi:hypothetical protein